MQQEYPRHANLDSCFVPDRCHCTCQDPARLEVDLDETPNPNFLMVILVGLDLQNRVNNKTIYLASR